MSDHADWQDLHVSVSNGNDPESIKRVATAAVAVDQKFAEKLLMDGPQEVSVDLLSLPNVEAEDVEARRLLAGVLVLQVHCRTCLAGGESVVCRQAFRG